MKRPKLYYARFNDTLYIQYPNGIVEFFCTTPFNRWLESAWTLDKMDPHYFTYIGAI